jgi:hypothetical protein
VVHPFEHITVILDGEDSRVEVRAFTCLEAGWLEQVMCTPGTREHEAILVTPARPSHLHAALLMAGFEPGSPGRWEYADDEYSIVPPSGEPLEILVRITDEAGGTVETPIRHWIRDHLGRHDFPDSLWTFSGSVVAPNPEFMGPGEHYVADMSGSVIGLVTFGDEVIGWSEVLPDAAEVHPPEWEVNAERAPPMGTEVTVILRRAAAPARRTGAAGGQ